MDQELALTLPKSDDFLSEEKPDRVWKLVYPDKATFYLNDEEREHFLRELADGKTIIQIGSLTLTNRLTYMYQYKNKPLNKQYKFENNTAKEV